MDREALDVAPTSGKKIAGALGAPKSVKSVGAAAGGVQKVELKGKSGMDGNGSVSESVWKQPKKKQETYAEQYLNAYKSRWMMTRDPVVSAFRARQSVLSRFQDYSALQRSDSQLE